MLLQGRFRLTKWLSSDQMVVVAIDGERIKPALNLDSDDLPTGKTLGSLLGFRESKRNDQKNHSINYFYSSPYSGVVIARNFARKDNIAAYLERGILRGSG